MAQFFKYPSSDVSKDYFVGGETEEEIVRKIVEKQACGEPITSEEQSKLLEYLRRAGQRISKGVGRVGETVSAYTTGEEWPEPPMMRPRPVQPQHRGVRMRHQPGSSYWGRPGYLARPPQKEPIINIFADSKHMNKPVNIFRQPDPRRRRLYY